MNVGESGQEGNLPVRFLLVGPVVRIRQIHLGTIAAAPSFEFANQAGGDLGFGVDKIAAFATGGDIKEFE